MDYEVIDREGLDGKLIIGEGTKIARRVSIDISGNVTIGKNCMIAEDVLIITHSHDINDFMNRKKIKANDIIVEDNVFVGARTIINDNVKKIGENSFIGAGSVLMKNVCKNTIVAGNPAIRIRRKEKKDD